MKAIPLLAMLLSATVAAPANTISADLSDQEYTFTDKNDIPQQTYLPEKRAALVLDRLLIALQKALHDESANQRLQSDREGPRTAPLRLSNFDTNDMTGLQRRGQGSGRGRVLRCYFNAITCF